MKLPIELIIVVAFPFFYSCSNNISNIEIEGVVYDESMKPISGAEVVILCAKDMGFWRENFAYAREKLSTNEKGSFTCTFEKGYKCKMAIRATGYSIFVTSKKKEKHIAIDAVLTKNDSEEAIYHTAIDSSLGIERNKIGNQETMIKWGIDITTGLIVNDTANATIWMQDEQHIRAIENGGVIPIISDDRENTNLLLNYTKAPTDGYKQIYKSTGKELGYFVKTNKGRYGKIILSGRFESINEQGNVLRIRKGFHVETIYQPEMSNSLTVNQSIDLERLLLLMCENDIIQ